MSAPGATPIARWAPYAMSGPAFLLFATLLLVPLLLTAILSFSQFDHHSGIKAGVTLQHYAAVLTDEYYHEIFLRTLRLSAVTTLICIVVGAPEAYILSRMSGRWRAVCLLVVLAPLLISVVVRAFGWSMLLGREGLVNQLLELAGIGRQRLLYTEGAVIVGLVHIMMPFMIVPVWTSLQKLDRTTEQAALSLGASPVTVFRRVVVPQVLPGILSGSLIVFGLSASAFAIPGLLGGRRIKTVATLIYDEYLHELNWPLGAAIAVILLIANLLIMLGYNRLMERRYRRALG
ncbi:ABC transporter permease [Ferrovibrio terrae]|uniref:ABC transporter permease n=1 Tax=Ferrovibrio terrae TaxID=2594003 RepID=UPI0031381AFB